MHYLVLRCSCHNNNDQQARLVALLQNSVVPKKLISSKPYRNALDYFYTLQRTPNVHAKTLVENISVFRRPTQLLLTDYS
jgi:hypothetical protein